MKRKLIYSMFAVSLLGVVGCGDDFLEPERNTQTLTEQDLADNIVNNPKLADGTLNGLYSYMITPGAGGTTDHDDFGQKAVDIWSDMLSGDMALQNNVYNWYGGWTNLQPTVDYTQRQNRTVWGYYFNIIRGANGLIANAGGNDIVPDDATARHNLGQAKALRAYGYFYLTQLFQRGYTPAQPILPLYTTPGLPAGPKVPASEIYALIVKDLTDAVTLLEGYDRGVVKQKINKPVAQGLLAYTYAAMGQYDQVKTITDDIIANSGNPLTTAAQTAGAGAGFNNVATASWMWGYNLNAELGIDLISWWGQVDIFTYSYAGAGDRKVIDNLLFSKIPVGDIRRNQFQPSGTFAGMPVNKFFHSGRVQNGQRNIDSDYIYMRVDEFYLLNAEASAKLGQDGDAKTRMSQLLALRMGSVAAANAYLAPLSAQALQDAIYLQTRIELWGEGKSYFALKRNKAMMTRGTNHFYQAGLSIPYDDDRLTLQIPISEMNNNSNITEQN